jgi:hypothetical protein
MMLPTIHSAGTTERELRRRNVNALNALRVALNPLHEASPRVHDFFVQGSGAAATAFEEHNARAERLQAVERELEQICAHIADQISERAKPHPASCTCWQCHGA